MQIFILNEIKEALKSVLVGETGEPFPDDICLESYNTDYQRGVWQCLKIVNQKIAQFENEDRGQL